MTISISNNNYHSAHLDNDDIYYVKSIIDKTINKYPDLDIYIRRVFKDNDIVLKKISDNGLVINIFAVFLHSLKDNETINNEEQLIKIVKGYVRNYLEAIFANRKIFIASHPVQYEPKVVSILAFSNYINREFSKEIGEEVAKNSLNTFETYYSCEFINAFRTLKSSLILFTIGDDIHAIALYRGFIEICSKVLLAEQYKEDYVKYKQYNINLQMYKVDKTPLPQEMIDDLGDNCKNENYLAYGWAKNKQGKRITTLTEFVNYAFDYNPRVNEFLHYSSEFIHEDYVGVGYDYIALRKGFIDAYFELSKMLLNEFKDIKKINKYKNLYNNVYYDKS